MRSSRVVYCVNRSRFALGHKFGDLVAALDAYVAGYFAPVWGTPARLVEVAEAPAGQWALIFFDDADAAQAEGYHDVARGGAPIGKVFVRTTFDAGDEISVTASHELAEMLVDPGCNMWVEGPRGRFYAKEVCDAVEATSFEVDGVAMSNFVFPTFFETWHRPRSTLFDLLGAVDRPFQTLAGGYQIIMHGGRSSEIYGSRATARRLGSRSRRGHRASHYHR